MKVRYIGESFGVAGLTNGKIYECVGVNTAEVNVPLLYIIDDEEEYAYLYSPISPGPAYAPEPRGRWEIVEDDENGTLAKIIPKNQTL